MSGLSVKVAIKQVDDAEEGLVWEAEVKEWELTAKHEVLEDVLLIMQRKIVTYLQNTLGTTRRIRADMVKASARVEFDIEVEKNKTLDMFTKVLSKPDGQKIVDTASTIMRIAEETGQDPLDIFAQAKAKLDAQKASGEAQH